MGKIWKYNLLNNTTELMMSKSAKFLHCDKQQGHLAVWFEVNDDTRVQRNFKVFLTGDEVPKGFKYLGTVLTSDETYVVHIYEII